MTLSEELQKRGYIYQFSSSTLEDIFDSGEKRTVYLGIDPTADSMHVGHLVPYMMLNHIMKAGHNVIALMGGGTALIGDPSFKENERKIASVEEIRKQCEGLEANVRAITTSDTIEFVNNYDWLSKLNAIEFLRDVGKHFTVNSMIKRESVVRRFEMEEGISYTEFSYSLLQGYDYYHLHIEKGCDVQIGGSDQWGNILSGVDFIRRKTGDEVFALTMPLIVDKATGKKFGKSEGNAVWLDAKKTSPSTFYQFWLNTSDESVVDYLKLFTTIPLDEINEIEKQHEKNPEKRLAQHRLAREVTAFVHKETSKEVLESIRFSSKLYSGEVLISELSNSDKELAVNTIPTISNFEDKNIVDVLISSELASSRREAREFIENKAVSIDGDKIIDPEQNIEGESGALKILKRGKKNIVILKF